MKFFPQLNIGYKPIGQGLAQRVREGAFILGLALSLFLLIALITFHNTDPGWSHTGFSSHITNAGGKAGAWFADLFLYIFGYCAYFFPLAIAYVAWLFLREKLIPQAHNFRYLSIRILGFLLILLAGDGLANLHIIMPSTHLPFQAGGIVGNIVSTNLLAAFNLFGTTVILVAAFLCGITLFTGLSWLGIIETIGRLTLLGFTHLVKWLTNLYQRCYDRVKDLCHRKKSTQSQVDRAINIAEPYIPTQQATPVVSTPISTPKPSKASSKVKMAPRYNASGGTLPSLELLDPPQRIHSQRITNEALEAKSCDVEARLQDFGIEAKVVAVHPGPVVTRFELQLAPGLKVSKISGLAKDLARSLSTTSVRIVEVIPGKSVIGLEIPNENREMVRLSEVLGSDQYLKSRSPLSLALGKDIAGHPVVVDLAKMPHLLVAGTTGSGKSVGLNGMLLSILFKTTPEQVRLILVDPKMLELSVYEGIPHLLAPVVTDMKEAANALRWCVAEMDRRYRLMASQGVRNLAGFNQKVKNAIKQGEPIADPLHQPADGEEQQTLTPLPYIVVVIDEFADMMMLVGKKVETLIARIAQKARAAGIHMILATQRPSVDVITGLIKSNIPTRIAFQVSSKIDSRTILDQQGAEQLLGAGDLLYLPPGSGVPVRVHGAFISDDEVHKVAAQWKQSGQPEYIDEITQFSVNGDEGESDNDDGSQSSEADPLYDQAVRIVTESRRASISSVQRRLKIGYNRAARMLEDMEKTGVVSPMESNGSREVLAPPPPKD